MAELTRDMTERPIVRYPDAAMQILDPAFAHFRINNAAVERLSTGYRWCEGPVWFGDGRYLLWSDIPNNRIMRWDEETGAVSIFRRPSNNANGNTRDRQGRLVTCEHDARRVTRTEYDGSITVIVDRFEGKRLNSPNDVVVKSDDAVWFTDPPFGILTNYEGRKAKPELPTNVYRVDRTGRATVVTGDVPRPPPVTIATCPSSSIDASTGGPRAAPGPLLGPCVNAGRLTARRRRDPRWSGAGAVG